MDERYDEIVDFAGPQVRAGMDMAYRHFSSGMQVRLAFALITTLDEPIVLVDEVLAVGDRAFREKCYLRMEHMLAGGKTLFMVSHSETRPAPLRRARALPAAGLARRRRSRRGDHRPVQRRRGLGEVSWGQQPLVGDPRARALRGTSSGGTLCRAGDRRSSRRGRPAVSAMAGRSTISPPASSQVLVPTRFSGSPSSLRRLRRHRLVVVAADLDAQPGRPARRARRRGRDRRPVVEGAFVARPHAAHPRGCACPRPAAASSPSAPRRHVVTRPTGYAAGVLRVRAVGSRGAGGRPARGRDRASRAR